MSDSPRDKSNPFYMFGDDSPTWLHRRAENNETILPLDLARIVEANPELVPDEFIRDLVVRALRGQLKLKRGPKPNKFRLGRDYYVVTLHNILKPRIEARRENARLKGIKRIRSDHPPAELAHILIARDLRKYLGLRMKPESVRNLISSLRNCRK